MYDVCKIWGCEKKTYSVYETEHGVVMPLCEDHYTEWKEKFTFNGDKCRFREDYFITLMSGEGEPKLNIGRCSKRVIDHSGLSKKKAIGDIKKGPSECWIGFDGSGCVFAEILTKKVEDIFNLLLKGVKNG